MMSKTMKRPVKGAVPMGYAKGGKVFKPCADCPTPAACAKGGMCKAKGMKKGGLVEYGGKEKYASKTAMKKHEGAESKKTERMERKGK